MVRIAALLLMLLAAGCGASEEHSARQPGERPAAAAAPEANVFTVPDELPPRDGADPGEDVGHNPDTAPPAEPPAPEPPAPDAPAEGAPSDEDVKRELAQALGVDGDQVIDQAGLTRGGLATVPPGAPPKVAAIINAANKVARAPNRYGGGHGGVGGKETWVDTAYDCSGSMSFAFAAAGLTRAGLATVPPGAPPEVAAIINAANKVARAPYRYGGGHGGVGGKETWVDTAYDCSGSMSFAFAAAGLLEAPMTSLGYMEWGRPGPGRWVTTFANEGHAFMVVAGLRFDTVERARTGTRWGQALRNVSGFIVRHPPGL